MNEHVSALLDDELPSQDLRETLDRLLADRELHRVWDRYHLIGDVMRGEGARITADGIAGQVQARLASEPPIIAAPAGRRRAAPPGYWLRPVAGAALAASVAALAVVSLPLLNRGDEQQAPALARTTAPAAAVPISPRPPVQYVNYGGTRWNNLETPGLESKLNRYLVDHSEYAASGGLGGVLPYASFVSYDSGNR